MVNWGIEGVHYKWENGVRTIIDQEKNNLELWPLAASDMSIIQQGIRNPSDREEFKKWYSTNPDLDTPEKLEEYTNLYFEFLEMVEKYGKAAPLLYEERPLDQQIGSTIGTYLQEAVSKVIIAQDFEAEYNNLIKGWEQLGGRDWDKEVTETLKKQGLL